MRSPSLISDNAQVFAASATSSGKATETGKFDRADAPESTRNRSTCSAADEVDDSMSAATVAIRITWSFIIGTPARDFAEWSFRSHSTERLNYVPPALHPNSREPLR